MNHCARIVFRTLLVAAGLGVPIGVQAAEIIIDHTRTNINALSWDDVLAAKSKLHIAYGHTSHGSQLVTGMDGLVGFMNGASKQNDAFPDNAFTFNTGGTGGALDFRDTPFSGANDLGSPNYTAWATATQNYLNANPDVNVIIWSWCGQADTSAANIQTYLNLMTGLEASYPDVSFVYMTGHLVGTGATGNLNLRNQQIRDYCTANDKILYDFADIESYDPDGLTNYMALNANDNCDYSGGHNWALDWQAAHTSGVDWYPCSPAHTQALNGNLKAYAAWTLWTEIAAGLDTWNWKGPGGGSFNLASNWTSSSVPNGVGATANFSGNITAPSTVTLNSPVTLGTINFDSSISYTIAGTSGLVLQTSGGNASVNVLSGNHTIAAGVSVTMASPTVFRVSNSTDSLTIDGNISGANPLTKDGLGTLILRGNNAYSGVTTVKAGTLELVGAASQSRVLTAGGVDLQHGIVVFSGTATAPAADVDAAMKASYNGGAWNIGLFQSTTAVADGLTLGWLVDPAGNVVVTRTLPGDFNLDGAVDLADLDIWMANAGTGDVWALGDANYDGAVDLADLDIWGADAGPVIVIGESFPVADGSAGHGAVPEPGTIAMLLAGLIGLGAFAWRKRRVM